MSGEADLHAELRELVHAARAQLEFERACGSRGIQLVARPVAVAPAPAARVQPVEPAVVAAASPPQPVAADSGDRLQRLAVLAQEAAACKACVLHEKRTQSVFARGSVSAELAFVGEG